jgi:hypothetical protein
VLTAIDNYYLTSDSRSLFGCEKQKRMGYVGRLAHSA